MAKRELRPDWRLHKALEKVPTGSTPPVDLDKLPPILRHPSAPAATVYSF